MNRDWTAVGSNAPVHLLAACLFYVILGSAPGWNLALPRRWSGVSGETPTLEGSRSNLKRGLEIGGVGAVCCCCC